MYCGSDRGCHCMSKREKQYRFHTKSAGRQSVCTERRKIGFWFSPGFIIPDQEPESEDFKEPWMRQSLKSCVQVFLELCRLSMQMYKQGHDHSLGLHPGDRSALSRGQVYFTRKPRGLRLGNRSSDRCQDWRGVLLKSELRGLAFSVTCFAAQNPLHGQVLKPVWTPNIAFTTELNSPVSQYTQLTTAKRFYTFLKRYSMCSKFRISRILQTG